MTVDQRSSDVGNVRPRHFRFSTRKFKELFQCIGLSSLVLLVNYNDFLNLGQNARFHSTVSLAGICVAELIAILTLGLVFFVIRTLIERTRFYGWARLLIMMFVPPYLLERVQPLIPFSLRAGVILGLAVLWAAVLLLFLLQFPKLYRLTIRVGDAVGIFAAVFGIFGILQLLTVMTWRPGPQAIQARWDVGPQPPREHPRVVWIVFDELSYDQLFGHRAQDLALPNFDRLRNESTLYTNIQPAGFKTATVIPSLLTGRQIDTVHFQFNNKLRVRYSGEKRPGILDGSATIFRDAQRAGWRTAAVGWYNPYCTIYGDALDSCYWSFLDRVGLDMAQDDSVWTNAKKPFSEIALQLYSPEMLDRSNCDFDVERHLKSQLDLESRALTLLARDQADLIFLHFPIPHSPNIWSRVNDDYEHRCGSSYLDNLALADRTLGALMAALQQSPRWKDTTVIVQGDHSWRIMLWNWLPSWTDQDEQASRNVFDSRPALLIHNAGQTQALTDDRALSLLFVHEAVEDVLHGKPVEPVKQQQAPSAPGQAVIQPASWAGASGK